MTRKLSYGEQLKHPNWQKKRLSMLDAAGWACSACESTDTTLHVHHKRYVKGRMAWEYDDEELQVLCEECHQEHHHLEDLLSRVRAEGRLYGFSCTATDLATGLTAGYLYGSLASELDPALAEEAKRCTGIHFDIGVIASAIAFAGRHHIAKFVRQIHEDCGFPMTDEVAEVVSRMEATGKAPDA